MECVVDSSTLRRRASEHVGSSALRTARSRPVLLTWHGGEAAVVAPVPADFTYTNTKLTNCQQPYLVNDHRYWFEYYFAWKPQGYSNSDYSDGFWRLKNQPAMSAAFSCSANRGATKVCIFG